MNKTMLTISMMILATASPHFASAQQAEQERDPFFSEGPRSAATGTVGTQNEGGWGRDPFSRPFAGAPAVQQARGPAGQGKKLTGIIFGGDVRIAIIDGETVREGGRVGDQKLAQIRPSSIVLVDGDGNQTEIVLENFSIQK